MDISDVGQSQGTPEGGKSYHHGDLRRALLRAAEEMLMTGKATDLSLRALARAVGVSPQAPYSHFRDKQALIAALVEQGFDALHRDLVQAASDGKTPRDRLSGIALAYIDAARSRPAIFRLMFSRELVDLALHPSARAAAARAFAAMRAVVADSVAPGADVDGLSVAAWSMVHGFATLEIEGALQSENLAGRRSLADNAARLVLGEAA